MSNPQSVDTEKAEQFAEKVLSDTSKLAVTLMAALGDVLGLFKELAKGPVTSAELAARAHINERYAREWLAGMLSAGYLGYDKASGRFSLPPEHVPALAQEGGPLFFGGTHQMILGLISVLDPLQQAFREGGGVLMSAYSQTTWDGGERDMVGIYDSKLVQEWVPAMPYVKAMLGRGVKVADIGCGAGRVLINLAKAFPASRYVGYDIFEPNLARATANAQAAGVADRVRFEALDATIKIPEQFDIITTFDVVHDATRPMELLHAIRRALQPGGRYVCLDVRCSDNIEENNGPMDTLRYGFSLLYCMTTSLANGGEGLGTSGLPESKLRALCKEAGFSSVRLVPLGKSFHNLYEITP